MPGLLLLGSSLCHRPLFSYVCFHTFRAYSSELGSCAGSKKRTLFLSSDDHSRSEWEERGEKGDFFGSYSQLGGERVYLFGLERDACSFRSRHTFRAEQANGRDREARREYLSDTSPRTNRDSRCRRYCSLTSGGSSRKRTTSRRRQR